MDPVEVIEVVRAVFGPVGGGVPAEALEALRSVPVSLIERLENVYYLSDARVQYRPRLYPLLDHWRYKRNQTLREFLPGYAAYLKRRWGVRHTAQLPLEVLAAATRTVVQARSRA